MRKSPLLPILLVAAAAAARAQGRAEPLDPDYTRGDPAALEKLGYRSLGPFAWSTEHDTAAVAQSFSRIGLLWVETEHFRIGSALAAIPVLKTDGKQGAHRLSKELERLAGRLPRLQAGKLAKLDRWLRLHLFAQRLEELRADFAGRLPGGGTGLPDKMAVLLFQASEDLERYLQTFHRSPSRQPSRVTLPGGTPLFVSAAAAAPEMVGDDSALHVHVVFHVVHNLVDAYKGYHYQIPVWFGEGLAHWFARRVDPKRLNWTSAPQMPTNMKDYRDWEVKVVQIAKHEMATPMGDMLRWLGYDKMRFDDHLVAWSRVDYLHTRHAAGLGVFLDTLKGAVDERGLPIQGEAVLARQEQALQKAWQLSPGELDEQWRKWVLARGKR